MSTTIPTSTSSMIRHKVERGDERFWHPDDFGSHPPLAVAKTLSRLAAEGTLQRVQKGIYYHPVETAFGPSIYSAAAASVHAHAIKEPIFPARTTAANMLGFTTQNPMRPQYSTTAYHPPVALKKATVYVRRPASWRKLETDEGALLEFLRDRGSNSEMDAKDTSEKVVQIFKSDKAKLEKITRLAQDEPARVKAMLGALGEEVGVSDRLLVKLRSSLSSYSVYDFGKLSALKHAKDWQAG